MKNTKIKFVNLYRDQWGYVCADVVYKTGRCRTYFDLNSEDGDKLPRTAHEFMADQNHIRIYHDKVLKKTDHIYG